MSDARPLITPQTRVGDLLKNYPELQEVLIEIAPAFKKLRNPVLLRTVAKVTSLAQAARVGNVPVGELVQRLRRAAGQPDFDPSTGDDGPNVATPAPGWFSPEKIAATFDARPMIDAGEQPIGRVLGDLQKLSPDQIYELITPFEPAPLIDKAREKGFAAWTRKLATNEYRTAFRRE